MTLDYELLSPSRIATDTEGPEQRFAEMAIELRECRDLQHTAVRVVELAQSCLGSAAAAGKLADFDFTISVGLGSNTRDLAALPSSSNYAYENLCLRMADADGMCTIPDTRADTQRPQWSATVADLGYLSVMSVPVQTPDRRYAYLTVFEQEPHGFDHEQQQLLAAFASHAAVALATSSNETGLRAAMATRKLIGQAQGIVMARYNVDADRAFEVLRRYSQDFNIKLKNIAQFVIDERGLPNTELLGKVETPVG